MKPLHVEDGEVSTVIVLSNGHSGRFGRFGADVVKQTLLVNNETVIGRMRRQLTSANVDKAVLVSRHEVLRSAWVPLPTFNPGPTEYTLKTLSLSRSHWPDGGMVAVLLGDVVFGDATLDDILGYSGEPKSWGDKAEIYALAMPVDWMRDIIPPLVVKVDESRAMAVDVGDKAARLPSKIRLLAKEFPQPPERPGFAVDLDDPGEFSMLLKLVKNRCWLEVQAR